jgi:hypothetical protein
VHRIRAFKRSTDPKLAAKLKDIVGLYVDPTKHAVVLSVDERSQVQALDRTQPGLPLKPGKAAMIDDYLRNAPRVSSPRRTGNSNRPASAAHQAQRLAATTRFSTMYQAQGRYADAEPLLQRALAILEKTHRPDHFQVAVGLNTYLTGRRGDTRVPEIGCDEFRARPSPTIAASSLPSPPPKDHPQPLPCRPLRVRLRADRAAKSTHAPKGSRLHADPGSLFNADWQPC